MNDRWTDLKSVVNDNDNFLIFTHQNMDGDALGSSSALCLALRLLGKNAYVMISEDVPHYLEPLSDSDLYTHINPFSEYAAFAVDCSEISRIEPLDDYFRNAKIRLCIDHHVQKLKMMFAEYSVIDPSAAAAAVLVYEFVKALNVEITKQLAEFIYLGISTDTGSFKFHNADAESLNICADLYKYGVDSVRICNQVYSTKPISQIKIEMKSIFNMEMFADGKAVISYITEEQMAECGGDYSQTDTCIDRLREIEGIDVACFVKDAGEGKFKASLRSKEHSCVLKVAEAFGGGGHQMAAGCTLECSLEEAISELKEEIIKLLN